MSVSSEQKCVRIQFIYNANSNLILKKVQEHLIEKLTMYVQRGLKAKVPQA